MDDQQTKDIKATLSEGQSYYPATRTIQSEWPKMATKGQGRGKKPISKVCDDQNAYDEFMEGDIVDKDETKEED
jgi:hypothetical protein